MTCSNKQGDRHSEHDENKIALRIENNFRLGKDDQSVNRTAGSRGDCARLNSPFDNRDHLRLGLVIMAPPLTAGHTLPICVHAAIMRHLIKGLPPDILPLVDVLRLLDVLPGREQRRLARRRPVGQRQGQRTPDEGETHQQNMASKTAMCCRASCSLSAGNTPLPSSYATGPVCGAENKCPRPATWAGGDTAKDDIDDEDAEGGGSTGEGATSCSNITAWNVYWPWGVGHGDAGGAQLQAVQRGVLQLAGLGKAVPWGGGGGGGGAKGDGCGCGQGIVETLDTEPMAASADRMIT